jgi:hypothetical protein
MVNCRFHCALTCHLLQSSSNKLELNRRLFEGVRKRYWLWCYKIDVSVQPLDKQVDLSEHRERRVEGAVNDN